MKTYSYQDCLATSHRINWRIEEVLGGNSFDLGKDWLPKRLSAAGNLPFLSSEEKRKLTHVEMGSYAHLFGYVEAFITPEVGKLASEQETQDEVAFHALTNFAAEEVKHMMLFRRVREMVNEHLGIPLQLIDGQKEVTQFVLNKNEGALLLLIACIEWFTQYHFLSAIKDNPDLDPLTHHIFRAHWLEESQHAKMDHNEAIRLFDRMNSTEREAAISDLIELVQAVDGLLQKQAQYDVSNFERYLGKGFSGEQLKTLQEEILATKRWVFIESGLTHPNFVELFNHVTTPEQRQMVQQGLAA